MERDRGPGGRKEEKLKGGRKQGSWQRRLSQVVYYYYLSMVGVVPTGVQVMVNTSREGGCTNNHVGM